MTFFKYIMMQVTLIWENFLNSKSKIKIIFIRQVYLPFIMTNDLNEKVLTMYGFLKYIMMQVTLIVLLYRLNIPSYI